MSLVVRRSLRCVSLAVVASWLWSSSARAQFCSNDTSLPDPSLVAPVSMVTSSPGHYFLYELKKGDGILPSTLVGITHEFTCHIPQPVNDGRYCTLANYPTRIKALSDASGGLLRLYGVLNHSPGIGLGQGHPFDYEQPYPYSNGKWSLTSVDPTFLDHLEAVVKEAYCRRVIVELTLLDPWDGDWTTGPFYPANTAGGNQGFPVTLARAFLSFENLSTKTDTSAQVIAARAAQQLAVTSIVNRLKRFPNLIWEVANEADFTPSGYGLTAANVADLEAAVVAWVRSADTAHLIMVNGHQAGAFGWNLANVSVASAHYTAINDTRYGATEMLRASGLAGARAGMATGFNENKAIGLPDVDADGVRAEAWEFAFNGGNLFDAYSVDYTTAAALTTQLGNLALVMRSPKILPTSFFPHIENLQQSSCNGASDWCKGVPPWDSPDDGTCSNDGRAYWAALKSVNSEAYGLYLHHAVRVTDPGSPNNPFVRYDARRCTAASYNLPLFKIRVPTAGCWRLTWLNPQDKVVLSTSFLQLDAGVDYSRPAPSFLHDIAVFLNLFRVGSCN